MTNAEINQLRKMVHADRDKRIDDLLSMGVALASLIIVAIFWLVS